MAAPPPDTLDAGDKGDDALAVSTSRDNGTCTVTVKGEIDAHTAEVLRERLDAVAAEPAVHLDLDAVGFMDSSGLRVLIAAKQQMNDGGRELRVVSASRPLTRLFEIAGVAEHLGLPGSTA